VRTLAERVRDGTSAGGSLAVADAVGDDVVVPDGAVDAVDDRARLRDLDLHGRLWAGAFAAGLLLAPVLAVAHYLPRWVPAGDPALMALRAWDVGTSRTPLIGQPSSSEYIGGNLVHHLGPTHYYLLAPAVRLFGSTAGMLLVSALIVGASLLVAVWGVFRQLGGRAAAAAAVVLGAVTFTTGAAAVANPVSSNISGYPLLASAVLLWCVLCGDRRLLPLAVLWVSFTAQQHLSVLPALTVMTAFAVAGTVVVERRRLREWARPAGVASVVAVVVWSPVLLQQVAGSRGNLGELLWFMRHGDRPKLGLRIAIDQVVNTLGAPPLVGQLNLDGTWFFRSPSPLAWLTAVVVVGLLLVAGWRWWAGAERRRLALLAMAGAAALGGLLDSASIPRGIEQYRLAFYHWAFVLTFLVGFALVLFVGDLAGRLPEPTRVRLARVGPALAVAVVAVPALVNPFLTRESSTLLRMSAPVERAGVDRLADAVLAAEGRLTGPVLVVSTDDGPLGSGLREALALELTDRGVDVVFPPDAVGFVASDRLADRSSISAGLVLVPQPTDVTVPGDEVADIHTIGDGIRWRLRAYRLDRQEILAFASDRF